MSKGGSQPAGNTTSTSTSEPWSGIVPYLNQGLQASSDLYAQGLPSYYPGQTYAGSNPSLDAGIAGLTNLSALSAPLQATATQGLNNAVSTASDLGSASNPSNAFFSSLMKGTGPGLDTLNKFSSGQYLSAENPYFSSMADTVRANVLPGINAQFANSGRANSGLAARAASSGLADAIGGLAYQNYQQGLQQQQSAAGQLSDAARAGATGLSGNQLNAAQLGLAATQAAPSIQGMGLNAANAALTAGQIGQQISQQQIDDLVNRYNYNSTLPQQNLKQFIANITAQSPGGGTTTQTQPYFQNQSASGLGGVLSGGMLGSALAPTLGLSAGLGTGLGAGLGLLALI